ncbi:MAG: dockerin type I repeat-containing protein, partial [Clostridia bacterium]|nr:dockerin type I repeat-containing protein [Clostridia bacterium]
DDSKFTRMGDLNGDGTVNLKDAVLLRRYIADGWNAEIDEKYADVNGDGAVNLKDVVMLRRRIAGGWDVIF